MGSVLKERSMKKQKAIKWTAAMRLEARANNEWMRRYIEAPEQFSREFQAVEQFRKESKRGKEPSYGEVCVLYMMQLKRELRAADRKRRAKR